MSDLEEKIREIDKELDQILGAKYGKDVRQSIHDSIAKCYDEATGKIQQELIDSITTNATNAAASAKTATDKASAASTSATSAAASAKTATDKASSASTSAANAEKYAKGDTDSALYYYNQCKSISQSLSGALKPKGTVAYSKLPSISTVAAGDMYNISDEFITNNLFKEGAGRRIPAGSNIYKTADSMWDVLAGSPVTGVKGAKESAYRQGNVEITAENIGALKVGGDVKDTTVTYTSNDSTTAPDATPPALLATGEKLSSLMNKISTLAKNIRWLLGKMGSTDISAIGDGTITGALSTLNSNLTFEYTYVPPNRQELGTIYNLLLIKVGRIVTANITFIPSTDISYSSDQAPLFVLPEGYRPYISHSANAPNVSGLSPLVLMIRENGNIYMQNISGPIKSGMYTTFQACWICA